MTELKDEKVRRNEIVSNRDKAQRLPGQSLDEQGVHAAEYKDNPTNQCLTKDDGRQPAVMASAEEPTQPAPKTDKQRSTDVLERVDRPGFDLGGSSEATDAGKGLGLGIDAKKNRKAWDLPR